MLFYTYDTGISRFNHSAFCICVANAGFLAELYRRWTCFFFLLFFRHKEPP